jgi:dTDP-4-amino-4,6-dideoxygalactose transaminase
VINVFQPSLGPEELLAVRDVFESGWIGRGPRTLAFEKAFAGFIGVDPDNVTSVNSCTEALFLSMELLGITSQDEVIIPSVSFVGAGNAVASRGARPVLCDSDPRTLNPTVEHVASQITPRTKAVMLLHYGGYPGDVEGIATLCHERGIALVEDAACALASRVRGRSCGAFGSFGAWSFDPMKLITMGDGGMLYCDDAAVITEARRRAYLGMMQPSGVSQAKLGGRWWEFEVATFSRRSIVNDIGAAIGTVQLGNIESFVARRRKVVAAYEEAFAGLEWLRRPPPVPRGHDVAPYLYWIQLPTRARDALAAHLYRREIYTTFRYFPLHLVPAFASPNDHLPGAEQAARTTLCLPLHQSLDDDDVERITSAVIDFAPTAASMGEREDRALAAG